MTENRLEDQVRNLAFTLWSTAGQQYGYALDYWIMAERMVLEATSASARFTRSVLSPARPVASAAGTSPVSLNTLCMQRTRELAQAMMQAAGAQYTSTLDFCVAAEKHMVALLESSARAAGSTIGAEKAVANLFAQFSADDYLHSIRVLAYRMWEQAGRPYTDPMTFWRQAEEEVIAAVRAASAPGADVATASGGDAPAPTAPATATATATDTASPAVAATAGETAPPAEPAPAGPVATAAVTPPASAPAPEPQPVSPEAAAPAADAVVIPTEHGPNRSAWTRGTEPGNRAEKPEWQAPVAATAEPGHDRLTGGGPVAPAAGTVDHGAAATPAPKRAAAPRPAAAVPPAKPAATGAKAPAPRPTPRKPTGPKTKA